VHHIVEWHKSRSHEPDNLVVLCLHDHDEAHTRHQISANLDPAQIRASKARWLAEVRDRDIVAATEPYNSLTFFTWDYFNHGRIAEFLNSDSSLRSAPPMSGGIYLHCPALRIAHGCTRGT
jgi:hypothetical protein